MCTNVISHSFLPLGYCVTGWKSELPTDFVQMSERKPVKKTIWRRGCSVISHFIEQQKVHDVKARHKSIRNEVSFIPALVEPLG